MRIWAPYYPGPYLKLGSGLTLEQLAQIKTFGVILRTAGRLLTNIHGVFKAIQSIDELFFVFSSIAPPLSLRQLSHLRMR